jgi:membrane-associated phospholipid phosphatase
MTRSSLCEPLHPKDSFPYSTLTLYLLLLLSWFFPYTRSFWSWLDVQTFTFLNASLAWHPAWKIFLAYMNADLLDRIMEILVFGLTFWGIYRCPGSFKKNFLAFLGYYVCFSLFFIALKWFLREVIVLKRMSPTFVLEDTIRLKGVINWKLKDASRNSFPADHALFLFLMYHYAKTNFDKTIRNLLLAITLIFTFPRLISGGHWLTDVFFGAWVPATLYAKGWFYSKINPFHKT